MSYVWPTGYVPPEELARMQMQYGESSYYNPDDAGVLASTPTSNYNPMGPITLPKMFWPDQAQYDNTTAHMAQFGVTNAPIGTLDPAVTSAYGNALADREGFLDDPRNIALVLMGGAAAGGAFAGGGAGYGAASAAAPAVPTAASVTAPAAAGAWNPALMGGASAAAGTASSAAAAAGGTIASRLPSILSGAASLLGGKLASDAAGDAVDAQVQAGREALDYQRESRDLALDIARPQLEASNVALARMLSMTGQPIPTALQESLTAAGITDIGEFDVTQDPSYQFRLSESMKALETSAFARGSGMSGGFAQYALRYAQDYASTEYSNIYGRLATVAGYGPVAANTSSGAALTYGANASRTALESGDARASGYVAQNNAWQNALDQIAKLPWDQWFNRQPATAGA